MGDEKYRKYIDRLELALGIAINELSRHIWCGDNVDPEGHPSVHQALIDINLARYGDHPFQKNPNLLKESE